MGNCCGCNAKPYFDTFDPSQPTDEEINKSRLWRCPDCKVWVSLIGDTKQQGEKNEKR